MIKLAPPILITAGEPAGIGPDLCVLLQAEGALDDCWVVADETLLVSRAEVLGVKIDVERVLPGRSATRQHSLKVWHHPMAVPSRPGALDVRNVPYILTCLESAISACQTGFAHGLVTGPVQKSVIADAGHVFSGHTEYLRDRTGADHVVMMLVGGGLRVALLTTHLPLAKVPAAVTPWLIDRTLAILVEDLKSKFGIERPRIKVAGLNPHAGESGHLGREEIEIILPALERARHLGADVSGPWPADTLFTPAMLEDQDAVLVMYHDQGLPVLKMQSFGLGVNITLGLPILRTSVDHGTALQLAGTGDVDPGSLREAIGLMLKLRAA